MMNLKQKKQKGNPKGMTPQAKMPDNAPENTLMEKASPERRCIISQQTGENHEMVRFVADPSGVIIPDVAAKLPGRGAWVTADRDMLAEAVATGRLMRALDGHKVNEDLAAQVESLLLKRCQDSLAMGRRGGITLGGSGKIKAECDVAGLLVARDASEREARALKGDVSHDWVISSLTSDELGLPFGRPMAFVALLKGHLSQTKQVIRELMRLNRLRVGPQ